MQYLQFSEVGLERRYGRSSNRACHWTGKWCADTSLQNSEFRCTTLGKKLSSLALSHHAPPKATLNTLETHEINGLSRK